MRLLLVLAALSACGNARKHDCEQLRTVIRSDVPRRYWDYEQKPTLRDMKWEDPEVATAVRAYLEPSVSSATGWTTYTPYSASGDLVLTRTPTALQRLQALCP